MEKVYGLAEARQYIGLSLEQIRNHIKSGRIKASGSGSSGGAGGTGVSGGGVPPPEPPSTMT